MASLPANRRRAGRPFGSRSRSSLKAQSRSSGVDVDGEGPPRKKRKYVPGGPGGGGRFIELAKSENATAARSPGRRSDSGMRTQTEPEAEPEAEAEAELEDNAEPVKQQSAPSSPPAQPQLVLPESQLSPQSQAQPQPPPQLDPQTTQQPTPRPAVLPVPTTPPTTRLRRDKSQNRGRGTSASAAALALQQGDGYKPREERGWEEFHPDLDIESRIAVFSAEEVDGTNVPTSLPNAHSPNGNCSSGDGGLSNQTGQITNEAVSPTPPRRRPGRPPRRPDAMLNGIVSPSRPKPVPLPGPNPRERLTLPKPSFHIQDPFVRYEEKGVGQQNYVDRTMASVGYQESDIFLRNERRLIRMAEDAQEDDMDLTIPAVSEGDVNPAVGRVEYDMDEQDEKWLAHYNAKRRIDQLEPIKPAIFEITMTKIEKEWHALEKRIPKPNPKPPQTQRPRSSSAAAVNGETAGPGEEQDTKCAVCDDGDCENSNAIVFCDGCDLAVHQECYGVPFIPEGQWLCRKCQLLGRGTTNCIFCPNTEGAFKQTPTSKWAHILCAIWIPEVSIGNPSVMEPITDVEKVPRSRWKLTCYICRQRMGASIQCSNKHCFTAFHVTCARKAKLYLKMKSAHGTPAVMDTNFLKAFCDKHVPPEWRREYGTDAATADAMEHYRNTMQGRQWGDSQAAALALEPSNPLDGVPGFEDGQRTVTPRITLTVGGNKRKRIGLPKSVWKLPSGAPVIPQVVLNSVIASLQRFCVRQRKQYAEDSCKYWTLKREARRGAALLKRLQLQLETFSSMEMTRRDYTAMGAAGTKRLQHRIEFGDRLYVDIDRLRMLCDEVKKREREKLKDAETLRSIIDIVYFPIPPLLWPIFEKAQALDGKGIFRQGLMSIRKKLEEREYTSVPTFSADMAHVFTSEIGVEPAGDTAELQMQISGRAPELSIEQREKRTLAKRIIKAIQPALEEAVKNESDLNRKPFEKELKDLDSMFENSVLSRRDSTGAPAPGAETGDANGVVKEVHPKKMEGLHGANGIGQHSKQAPSNTAPAQETPDVVMADVDATHAPESTTAKPEDHVLVNGEIKGDNESIMSQVPAGPLAPSANPLTPPASSGGDQQLPLAQGGIQWYMQPFDPIGTTIHEERWTGRDVMRGMSEELSEIDDEELNDLAIEDEELEGGKAAVSNEAPTKQAKAPAVEPEVKIHRTRRREREMNK